MANVQIKNEKIKPFGGIYFVTSQFKPVERAIDEYLGRRCESAGYRYGEIVRAMMCNFFCGGDRTEDINNIGQRVIKGAALLVYFQCVDTLVFVMKHAEGMSYVVMRFVSSLIVAGMNHRILSRLTQIQRVG